MKGSKELIEHYNKRKEALGEKATKLNMYLEGYAEGYRDTKAYMIDKACECFELAEDWQAWANGDFEYAKSYFRKVMEE